MPRKSTAQDRSAAPTRRAVVSSPVDVARAVRGATSPAGTAARPAFSPRFAKALASYLQATDALSQSLENETDAQGAALCRAQVEAGFALARCPVTSPAEACELLTIAFGNVITHGASTRAEVESARSAEGMDFAMFASAIRGLAGDPWRDVLPKTEAA